jgi:serine/threonine protein kinase
MEHCPGGSLAQRLRDKQSVYSPVWVNQVVQWMIQLCDTLVVVHARGLVHHDIKPANILLRDGMAVLADFGIVNTTGGTVIYCSPGKGLGSARRDDAREDIYSLGVTLLELLNRVLPQSQQTALLALLETLNKPQEKIYALNSPFETKDMLKARGYRWSAELRCWSRLVAGPQEKQQELDWLKNRVYGQRSARVEVETQGGQVRYSSREGHKEMVTL